MNDLFPEGPVKPERVRNDSRNSAALWKLLWDFDPNGLLVLDEELRVIQVNPALCQMLKSQREDLLGRKAADLLGDVSRFSTRL